MLKIGLTGGISSGKSTVAEIFSNLGVTVIDADHIAHQLMQPGSECFNEIKLLLGEKFIDSNGELDRKKIAPLIFSNPSKKIALENILHPKIKQRMLREIEQEKCNNYIILSIPLLFESNFTDLVDRVLVVDADDNTRIKRTLQRDERSEKQIRDIMSQQIDRAHRLQQADDIIENDGSFDSLRDTVNQLHQKYIAMTV